MSKQTKAAIDETQRNRLEAERDRLREALVSIDALDPEGMIDGCSPMAIRGLVMRMGEIARAALEAGQ